MLPSFPKAQQRLADEWQNRMFEAKSTIVPPQLHPRVLKVIEAKRSDFQRDDGKIKPFEMKLEEVNSVIDISDGKGMSLVEFYGNAQEIGEGLGRKIWDAMMGTINEAVAETGNTVTISKTGITKEDFIRIIDKTSIDFDQTGKPTNAFVLSPAMADSFTKASAEWSTDQKFQDKVEEIKRRKREEFDEREARRRLVD